MVGNCGPGPARSRQPIEKASQPAEKFAINKPGDAERHEAHSSGANPKP